VNPAVLVLILSFSQQLLVLILALWYDLLLLFFIKTSLYYWHRDAQHVAVYGREKRCERLRLSLEPFGNQQNIDAVPLYAVEQWCGA
jgi:hypothetical protein